VKPYGLGAVLSPPPERGDARDDHARLLPWTFWTAATEDRQTATTCSARP